MYDCYFIFNDEGVLILLFVLINRIDNLINVF